jgi:hypothetical protein
MSEKTDYHCPVCEKELRGGLVLIIVETDAIASETLFESPERNWMKCHFCELILCKECGSSVADSYCHPCRERGDIRQMPQDMTHRVKLTVLREEIIANDLTANKDRIF